MFILTPYSCLNIGNNSSCSGSFFKNRSLKPQIKHIYRYIEKGAIITKVSYWLISISFPVS
ncbi:hypothetical protein CW304_29395 [Bacillus sp. UFRGS-B20]|nr:hypothetical protein CW304_29395 [Bacillus sp. UFRGS-B20]